MFQKVFEYAGPHKKGLYAATAIVLVSVLMGVLPFVLAYQVIAPLVMGESIGASFIISRVALVLACLVLQALFYGWGLNLSHKAASGFMRKIQSPAIEKGLQHQTRQDKSHARNDKGCSNRFTHDQRRYHLISQHKGQDTHQDADQHDGRCCIKPLLMRPCILKYFLKHNSNLLIS